MLFRPLVAFALLLLITLSPPPAAAQISLGGSSAAPPDEITLPDPLTPEGVRELVARMSDDQVRRLLLERLDAVAAAQAEPDGAQGLAAGLTELWTAFAGANTAAISKLPILFTRQAEAFARLGEYYGARGLAVLFGLLAVSIVAGLIAEWLTKRLTRRWNKHQTTDDSAGLLAAIGVLLRRFLHEIVGLVAFYVVMTTVGLLLMNDAQLAFAAPLVLLLIFLPRVAAAFWRMILAPNRPELRLINVNDHWAAYLYRHNTGMITLIGLSIFIVMFNQAMGIAMGETRIGYWLNLSVHIYVIYIAWNSREGLVEMMRGADPDRTGFDEAVARAYPYFAIAVSVGMWVIVNTVAGLGMFELLQTAPHYTSMFWLLMTPAFDTAIRGVVRHLLPPMAGEGAIAEAAYRSTKRGYIKIGRVIVGIFIVMMIAGAWQIDLKNLAAAGIGQKFAGQLIEFLMISAIGYMIFELVTLWINRKLAHEQTSLGAGAEAETGGEGGGAGGSRLTTVLPLVRVSAQVAIAVIFGLVALGALGVDTTPLLAGAGILGLAIGFGAQKLVTDIVSGIFFLIDDAFRVGEYVDIGGTMGVVEKISIRSMQLRHHRGLVHTVPYGEIPKLTNFSRDWVIMKLKFTVPFDTDPNKVKKLFKKIGAEMMQDPIHKDGFLEPFKSQGVFAFDDVGMVVRGKFMAKPGAQFTIRKEIYNRVKKELEGAGIPFARREVRVAIPGLGHADELDDKAKTEIAATAAAADVARQQQAAPPEK